MFTVFIMQVIANVMTSYDIAVQLISILEHDFKFFSDTLFTLIFFFTSFKLIQDTVDLFT